MLQIACLTDFDPTEAFNHLGKVQRFLISTSQDSHSFTPEGAYPIESQGLTGYQTCQLMLIYMFDSKSNPVDASEGEINIGLLMDARSTLQ